MKYFASYGLLAILCLVSTLTFAQTSDSTSTRSADHPFSSVETAEITMYPNPTDGVAQVSLRESINETIVIKVYNRSGEEVYKHSVHFLDGKTEIHVKHLQPGIYVLQVQTAGKTYSHYFSKL